MNAIDTEATASRMRDRIIDINNERILLSVLEGSAQESDLSVPPNCGGIGRIRHFNRETGEGWPDNPLPIDPAAAALGNARSSMSRAQVFQNAACAWRCWYCYVPYELLAGHSSRAEWISPYDMVSQYVALEDRPSILDLSGGSPDLTPEWIPWTMRALRDHGLEGSTYLWSDDNLSTDHFFTELTAIDRQLIAEYENYGRVCCFKGFDHDFFAFNTSANPQDFDLQFDRFSRYLDTGIDLYGYVTLTGQSSENVSMAIANLLDRMQAISPLLPLRTVPLRIEPFGPMLARRPRKDMEVSLQVQEAAIAAWTDGIADRFGPELRCKNIFDIAL